MLAGIRFFQSLLDQVQLQKDVHEEKFVWRTSSGNHLFTHGSWCSATTDHMRESRPGLECIQSQWNERSKNEIHSLEEVGSVSFIQKLHPRVQFQCETFGAESEA